MQLFYGTRLLYTDALSPGVDSLAVSDPSPSDRFAIGGWCCQRDENIFLFDLPKAQHWRLRLEGPLIEWVSWSPREEYAVVSSYWESDQRLYVITLDPPLARRVPFRLWQKGEEPRYDLKGMKWLQPAGFQIGVDIICNPDQAGPECRGPTVRRAAIRSYVLGVNAATMTVSAARDR